MEQQITELASQLIAYRQQRGDLKIQRGIVISTPCGTARMESHSVYLNGRFYRTDYRFETPWRSVDTGLKKETVAPAYKEALISSGLLGA